MPCASSEKELKMTDMLTTHSTLIAISSVHEKVEGLNIGQHPLVTRPTHPPREDGVRLCEKGDKKKEKKKLIKRSTTGRHKRVLYY